MRLAFLVMVVLLASASAALAHVTKHAWTTGKAQVMLPDSAMIAPPADVIEPLTQELDGLLAEFRLLELTAQQGNDWLAAGTYANYIRRFGQARDRLRTGLPVDSATCRGLGAALKGKRYRHFTCWAASYVLEVPTVELQKGADGSLPRVIEGPTRRFGPYPAVFTLHVTGPGQCVPQRLS